MTDELKHCAHCGTDAKWIQEIQQSPDSVRLGYVRCSECEIRTGSMLTKSEAIAAWNRRVEPIGNSDELPEWFIKRITQTIDKEQRDRKVHSHLSIPLLKWVLSLRREDAE